MKCECGYALKFRHSLFAGFAVRAGKYESDMIFIARLELHTRAVPAAGH
jgi:hypothetical protein